jgi:hypothetical protein
MAAKTDAPELTLDANSQTGFFKWFKSLDQVRARWRHGRAVPDMAKRRSMLRSDSVIWRRPITTELLGQPLCQCERTAGPQTPAVL